MNNRNLFIENSTIKDIFESSLKKYRYNTFLSYPKLSNSKSDIYSYSFNDVSKYIKIYINYFKTINLQYKDRVCVMIGNLPEFFIIKLSLNYIGISCVPLNYELKNKELGYIIRHSKSKHFISSRKYVENVKLIINQIKKKVGLSYFHKNKFYTIKSFIYKNNSNYVLRPFDEASLIYTSGTTGKPKGCIMSHFYEINAGYSYIKKKGLIAIKKKKEKIYNCLPVHHVNAGILSFYAVLLTGNCQIQAKRFSATTFWKEIKYSKATIFHYLGVMVPILLKQKKTIEEKRNNLKLGVGAGIEPNFHSLFEKRFNIPMIELWGMTEMVRCIFDYKKNRKIGKRCFGKPDNSLEVKVIDNFGKSLINEDGEMIIRHNKSNPKKGFFDGYFKNKRDTNKAWRDGWFHTGDIVRKDRFGYLYFIDRKKNIIRRSGENISSAEVEDNLLSITKIKNVAVCSYPHKVYEEEIIAFIILKDVSNANLVFSKRILYLLSKKLVYFKLPAYIQYTDELPLTSSQKIRKADLMQKINNENKSKFFDLSDYKKLFKN